MAKAPIKYTFPSEQFYKISDDNTLFKLAIKEKIKDLTDNDQFDENVVTKISCHY